MVDSFPCPYCGHAAHSAPSPVDSRCAGCGRSLVLCSRFALTGLLGQGGMGSVYAAVAVDDGQPVAVKVVEPARQQGWKASELFERSAAVLRGLDSPGVPRVYAFERDLDGRLILVRERFDGGTLEERIGKQRCHLKPDAFRTLAEDLLELLADLHGRVPPLVHRDIKPSNIMFRAATDWDPVLVDFDTVHSPGASDGMTIVGTPGYGAPEQFAGDASPRSDLYGLGATLLFVATHVPADALPRKQGRFDVEHLLGTVESDLRELILRLVEPDPQRRPKDAAAALAALATDGQQAQQAQQAQHGRTVAGGESVAQAMLEDLLETFERDTGINGRLDERVVRRVRGIVPEALRELQTYGKVRVNLPFLSADHSGPKHLQVDLIALPDGGWAPAPEAPDDGYLVPPRAKAVSGPRTLPATKVAGVAAGALALFLLLGGLGAVLMFAPAPSGPAIEVTEQPGVVVEPVLEQPPAPAPVAVPTCRLLSEPTGAKVFRRGAQLGVTPLVVTVPGPLPMELVLTAPRHRNQTVAIRRADVLSDCERTVRLVRSAR